MPDRLIALPEVRHLVGLGTSTIYRRIARGAFPRQIELSPTCVRWRESAIAAWIEALASPPGSKPAAPEDAD